MEWDAEDRAKRVYARFSAISREFWDALGPEGGGQGWIRTSVRKPGQIYSLLPLTTRPPVHWGPLWDVAQWRNEACLSLAVMGKARARDTFPDLVLRTAKTHADRLHKNGKA